MNRKAEKIQNKKSLVIEYYFKTFLIFICDVVALLRNKIDLS
jgi:hypothetical protein